MSPKETPATTPIVCLISDDVSTMQVATDRIAQIRKYLPAARKLVEVLEESEAHYDDERHAIIREVAQSVDVKAKKHGDTLLAKYAKTREHRSATGAKAARTRKRRAPEKASTP